MRAIRIRGRGLMRSYESQRSSEAGAAHPALPAVILLVSFAVFMAAIAPLNFSGVLARIFPASVKRSTFPEAVVWIDHSAGVYYCADSIMFGKAKGEYMEQVAALDRGYQPALGTYCKGPKWPLPAHRSASSGDTANPPNPAADTGPSPFEKPGTKPAAAAPAIPH
jgi:hypothetical protein